MFDLGLAIEKWRQQMRSEGFKAPGPLEELESHLLDDVEHQVGAGLSLEEAFETASKRIGSAAALKEEFKKIQDGKPIRKLVWTLLSAAWLGVWLRFGDLPGLAFVYSALLTALIVASFIDFARFAIPDTITLGGIAAGLLCSLALPQLHGQSMVMGGVARSLIGIGVGAGLLYCILRVGKLAFGRQRVRLANETRIVFTEKALWLPDGAIPFDDLFFRGSDTIVVQARTVEIAGATYQDVPIRLTRDQLWIGADQFDRREVPRIEATTAGVTLPREAMGMGDVKFMAAIGAFLGWQAVLFSLAASSLIGSAVGCVLIAARRRQWTDRLPFGPYIALAAAIWIFWGHKLLSLFAP